MTSDQQCGVNKKKMTHSSFGLSGRSCRPGDLDGDKGGWTFAARLGEEICRYSNDFASNDFASIDFASMVWIVSVAGRE